ncbi:polysaccharide biosynthesis C-terminal domain-containing protein [Vibrio ordalii]|uniref:Polysaccharide biosynthesis protein C-terminal domain-containing protein n=1 Tax=Vibrio ordalii FS-238 TaxID=617133 RepID=A0A853R848_9VIBR|nr:polysaccharide biosynthesis C-terminal domain-containing protein [Vibrio ordalii]OEE41048.1 hypothetical protein A1QS_02420 [Vibrio ordalii FS-238]
MIKKNVIILSERYAWLIASFIYTFYLAKTINIEIYGSYSLILSYVTIVSFYSLLSLNQTDIKDIVSKRNDFIDLIFGKMIISIFMFAFVSMITYFFYEKLINSVGFYSIFFILLAYFFSGASYADIWTQSDLKLECYLLVRIILIISLLCLKIYLVDSDTTLFETAILFFLDYFLLFIWSCIFLFKNRINFLNNSGVSHIYTSIKKYTIKIRNNYHLVLSFIMITMYSRIDQYMIGTLSGNINDVAYLSILSKMQEGLTVIVTAFGISQFPNLVKSKLDEKYNCSARRFTIKSMIILMFLAVLYYCIAPYIVKFIFNHTIENYVILLYSISIFFCGLSIVTGRLLIIDNLPKVALYRNIVALILNLCINYFLIPLYSIQGAAIASCVSWFISGFLFLVLYNKTRYYFFRVKVKNDK